MGRFPAESAGKHWNLRDSVLSNVYQIGRFFYQKRIRSGPAPSCRRAHPLVLQDPHHPGRVPGSALFGWDALIVEVGHDLAEA